MSEIDEAYLLPLNERLRQQAARLSVVSELLICGYEGNEMIKSSIVRHVEIAKLLMEEAANEIGLKQCRQ